MTEQEKQAEKRMLIREKRMANLRSFEPGKSGNPGGRPRGPGITQFMRRHLMMQVPKTRRFQAEMDSLGLTGDCTFAEYVARSLIMHAAKGNATAISEVMDRMEGKIPTPIQHTGDGGPITLRVIYGDRDQKIVERETVTE